MSIGQRIRLARKANNMSLRKLAQAADVSAMAISKYERDFDVPSSRVLIRIADSLDVAVDFFFRPQVVSLQLQAYRKHTELGAKEQEAIQMRIQEWLERYLEVESYFMDEAPKVILPINEINSMDQIEDAASDLREKWDLGYDAIEDFTQLLEDKGIKVGLVSGYEHFDACTLMANGNPVIVSKTEIPGDRQRFNLGHELGHLVLNINNSLDQEAVCHRFVGAFIVPKQMVHFELGSRRTSLDINELHLLKQKYGLSMQAWIHRANDLGVISDSQANRLRKQFQVNGWNLREPGKQLPAEEPLRMQRLIYRALAEDLISRSKAQELLGVPLPWGFSTELSPQNVAEISSGY